MRTLALVGVLVATLAVEALCGFLPAVNLGPRINGPYSEMGADISPDGRVLVFASNRPGGYGYADLYGSIWQNSEWSEPFNLGPQVNSGWMQYGPVFSGDGNTVYFVRDGDLYQTTWDGAAWGSATRLPGAINMPRDEQVGGPTVDGSRFYFSADLSDTQDWGNSFYSEWDGAAWGGRVRVPIVDLPESDASTATTVTPRGDQLVIGSTHPGGRGGQFDLWVTTQVNGIWQPPVNLGPNVNTTWAVETAAQFSAGGDTILFDSDRPSGYGFGDVWMAVVDRSTLAAERGDLDCSSQISVIDVTRSVDRVFRGAVPPNPCVPLPAFDVADVNCDGILNISDVVAVIGLAFRGGAPLPACGP